uniref:Ribosomal protein L29 n=1 Tax=Nitzschia putrida TaxID=2742595 RepID=A0A7R7YPA7_9STRA|nr:ribosomal protein L29 [Nitzschia putrida]
MGFWVKMKTRTRVPKLETLVNKKIKKKELWNDYFKEDIIEELYRLKEILFMHNYQANYRKQLLKTKHYSVKSLKKRMLRLENLCYKQRELIVKNKGRIIVKKIIPKHYFETYSIDPLSQDYYKDKPFEHIRYNHLTHKEIIELKTKLHSNI